MSESYMYGVWHTGDKEWVSFDVKRSEAAGVVSDYGDHLKVKYVKLTVEVLDEEED